MGRCCISPLKRLVQVLLRRCLVVSSSLLDSTLSPFRFPLHHDPACIASSRIGIRCSTNALGVYDVPHAIVAVGVSIIWAICDCAGQRLSNARGLSPFTLSSVFLWYTQPQHCNQGIHARSSNIRFITERSIQGSTKKGIVSSIFLFVWGGVQANVGGLGPGDILWFGMT